MTIKASHWWKLVIEVENDYRDSYARLEYRWFTPDVTRFESSWTQGCSRSKTGSIRIYVNGNLKKTSFSKDEAVSLSRLLMNDLAKGECLDLFRQHFNVFEDAILGKKNGA